MFVHLLHKGFICKQDPNLKCSECLGLGQYTLGFGAGNNR